MELFALLVGAGVVAVSPLVPGLRPVAKAAVAGGIVLADKTKDIAATATEQWMDIVAETKAERRAEAVAREEAAETITIDLPEESANG